MKELLERHKARLTPDEDRRIWQGLTDARRNRPLWKRWKISVPALAATAAAAFAVAIMNQGTVVTPTHNLEQRVNAPAGVDPGKDMDLKAKSLAPAPEAVASLDETGASGRVDGNAEPLAKTEPEARERKAEKPAPATSPPVAAAAEEAAPSRIEARAVAGTIKGTVRSAKGEPLPFANVIILGTRLGAMTDTEGRFTIRDVPLGNYTLQVTYLGYASAERSIAVVPRESLAMDIQLEADAAAMDKIVVEGRREMIRRADPATKHVAGSEELERLPVDTFDEAQALKSGVTTQAGDLNFRGGRAGELQYQTDGKDAPASSPAEPSLADRDGNGEKKRAEEFRRQSIVPEPIAVGGNRPVNDQTIDAMFFQHYGVNPFVDPEEDRFATFAMDVDHASYALARSYLRRGVLPPQDAIRVEEFVNAFDHRYAAPDDQLRASREISEHGTFAIHLDTAPSPFGQDLVLLRAGLKGREIHERNRKPARLTFVIDVSGSMAREDRLGLVKQSLYLLLDRMNEEDEVALVVYGSNARTVLEPTSLLYRRSIERAIASLHPEGATNAEAGLSLGYSIAERNYRDDCINRVILCSDGVANMGRTGADGILDEIHRRAGEGIYLTAAGFGMGNYNDVLMEQLADRGEGNYYYIDTVDEARDVFLENLMGTLQVIARQAKIQVEFDPETVRRYRLIGYENRDVADRDFRNDKIDAGEVGAGHEVTALFELKLNRRPGDVVGIARIRYEDPETGRVTEEKRELRTRDLVTRLDRAEPSLRLDAAVAEFAEILRHSYWAKDGRLDRTLGVARDAARDLGPSEETTEFLSMIETAARLWPAERPDFRDDAIRPAWEPEEDR